MSRKLTTDEFISRSILKHGNPNIYKSDDINKSVKLPFGELYRKTINREKKLKEMGFKIVSIWESDFDKNKNIL